MPDDMQGEVTRLLQEAKAGCADAMERLITLAYDELRGLASQLMSQERTDHTLQPTALVNEAALRWMSSGVSSDAECRAYFFESMAATMRRVLVDHARARRAARRGGGQTQRVQLDEVVDSLEQANHVDLIALDEALSVLEHMHARQAHIISLRFFCGLSMSSIAEQLGISLSTVEKDWKVARAWLKRRVRDEQANRF